MAVHARTHAQMTNDNDLLKSESGESDLLQYLYQPYFVLFLKKNVFQMTVSDHFTFFFSFHRKVLEQRDSVYEKISQYLQLKSIIQSLQVLFLLQSCQSLETEIRPWCSLEGEEAFIGPRPQTLLCAPDVHPPTHTHMHAGETIWSHSKYKTSIL